ncbi:selenium cofactor biosynthesis protein YqeC [Edwardsiella ictaluri]|uniref:selenium cofactor biosynthesis protein YqeC n=2 Tax=Edwardsiella ictaluri TaxID=67780 RepID=UPI0002DFB6DE|nr:putative selenium-dependent hydroxylase accessory protein YqeC [Edwardsiella ictaluri]BEI00375.1 selenium cofactor biosynthesis protein YqeC [Edwardsiella ictaluri]BEI03851.1 selenium cofactor biosynthesis protein YqeC [Edwardsiella ictaluri]BEI07307.1 selenium cofactor biosynthesis protein YqeC [Edwardsiella ictaluri]BEI10779.1 selenium cofactor biosynthesis protein YqeC [Edwardsiella ictaluri]
MNKNGHGEPVLLIAHMPNAMIPELQGLLRTRHAEPGPLLISLIGAGGKTSALHWLARAFAERGLRVMVTTTTRMYLPDTLATLFCRHPASLPATALRAAITACFAAWDPVQGKVRGFTPAQIDALSQRRLVDVILVEADGAHQLPLKAPAGHEPCIPERSHCVIAVSGGQTLGHPIGGHCVHRWPLFSARSGLTEGECLDMTAMGRFIRHPLGMFKGTPTKAHKIWLINRFYQSDNVTDASLYALLNDGALDAVWLGAVREQPPITRILQRHDNNDTRAGPPPRRE